DFSATAHTPYLIAAIGIVGIYGKWINTFRQRLGIVRVWVYSSMPAVTVKNDWKQPVSML
ncbi:MAG: hypothetical protein ABFS03_14150, partial [Chloroflexota bacterium]